MRQNEEKDKIIGNILGEMGQLKSQNVMLETDRESLLFYVKEMTKKFVHREHMYSYALSAMSERDQEAIQEMLKELSIML